MSRLFGRSYKLTLDDIEIEGGGVGESRFGLDVKFKVESSTKAGPNKIDLDVYNLNPDHRSALLKQSGSQVSKKDRKPVPVQLEAGYEDDRGVIFRGELRNLVIKRDGGDFDISLAGSDAGYTMNVANINRNFAPGTRVFDVVLACANELGVGVGNLAGFSDISFPNLGSTFSEGYAINKSADKALTDLLFRGGLTWSVQRGVIQVKKNHRPVDGEVYLISPETGLVGTPEPEVDATVLPATTGKANPPVAAKRTGLIKVRTLLLHQLYPGAKIDLESESFKGGYQITQIDYLGETSGNDWYCDLLVRPY